VDGNIRLKINGEAKQQGDLNQMIWKMPEIIAELSKLFTPAAGDIIMTGTPSGAGPVSRGDVASCGIDGVATLTITVV
jgi:fumarylpyruvate hydrolase